VINRDTTLPQSLVLLDWRGISVIRLSLFFSFTLFFPLFVVLEEPRIAFTTLFRPPTLFTQRTSPYVGTPQFPPVFHGSVVGFGHD